jgi:hypothetical protein
VYPPGHIGLGLRGYKPIRSGWLTFRHPDGFIYVKGCPRRSGSININWLDRVNVSPGMVRGQNILSDMIP